MCRTYLLMIFFIFLIGFTVSCTGLSPLQTDTSIPAPTHVIINTATAKAIPTLTATSDPTPTSTATHTPSPPTLTPTATHDLDLIGVPEKPFQWQGYNPSGFLEYDEGTHHIYQSEIHGRVVTVAWEKAAEIPSSTREKVSDFYFDTFIRWWEIFQGFPYESYTVVLEIDPQYATGEHGIGYEGVAQKYTHDFEERIAHEVFHAWVGNALRDMQQSKFDDGLWFREGITQYYGDRGAGEQIYSGWMSGHWNTYQSQILGTDFDIPLSDMPAAQYQTGEMSGAIRLNVYWKGALVAYMMDERLASSGLSLDDLLKYLYDTYALNKSQFTTNDVKNALNELTGEDWSPFFSSYIYGIDPLPLDGKFEFIRH